MNAYGDGSSESKWRHYLVIAILIFLALIIFGRLVQLMVVKRSFLLEQGNARTVRFVSIPAMRGIISDRNGEPLAISTPVQSVYIVPKQADFSDNDFAELAKLLKRTPASLRQTITTAKFQKKEFLYLKRSISPALAEQIDILALPGVNFIQEYRRYYPESESAAHILGFTNIDDEGQEGIELTYNKVLRGVAGKKRVVKDRLGRVIEETEEVHPSKPGTDITLSIDHRIQSLAYRELKKAIDKHKAKSGSVVVLDTKTGEVLSMVNLPSYNPNRRPAKHDDRYRNRAVTDEFEPGSTIKLFSVLNALQNGPYQADTPIPTSPGYIMLNGHEVKDARDNGTLDLVSVLRRSSNVGISKVTLSLPKESLWETLHSVGFGEQTGIRFVGETQGKLPYRRKWRDFELATLSFGYGLAVTPLQLARAYSVFGNDGVLNSVSLERVSVPMESRRVISSKDARGVLDIMESVVDEGGVYYQRAKIPGYRVGGKTGTVRMVGPRGYDQKHHRAIFVGMAPMSDPRLAIVVLVNDPTVQGYYGGQVAIPVFTQVMSGALRLLDVPPDKLDKPGAAA